MLTSQDIKTIQVIVNKAIEVGKDELLNTKKCAEWLGISVDALHKRCEKGKIPCHRKHGVLYFSKNEVYKYYLQDIFAS